MRIGILGSGNMGAALGRLFAIAGHEVTFSYSRDPAKLERLARRTAHCPRRHTVGCRARCPRRAPCRSLDPGPTGVASRGKSARQNPDRLYPPHDGLGRASCGRPSHFGWRARRPARPGSTRGEGVQEFRRVLRAGASVLPEQPMVCYCGNKARGQGGVSRLIREIGFEPVNCGGLVMARSRAVHATRRRAGVQSASAAGGRGALHSTALDTSVQSGADERWPPATLVISILALRSRRDLPPPSPPRSPSPRPLPPTIACQVIAYSAVVLVRCAFCSMIASFEYWSHCRLLTAFARSRSAPAAAQRARGSVSNGGESSERRRLIPGQF